MTTLFTLLTVAMLLVALAFVLVPLLRTHAVAAEPERIALEQAHRAGVLSDDEFAVKLATLPAAPDDAPRPARALAASLALLLPLGAILLYHHVGEPRALDDVWRNALAATSNATPQQPGTSGPDMEQAVAGLAERLRQEPDDLEGWMLLGRAYKTMERFDPAREALVNAYRLAPENPDVLVEYAEAMVLASSSRRFSGEPLMLLQQALNLQPQHPRGQWMLGIGAYQDERFADAAAIWESLLNALPPDADARDSLLERITDARQRAGLPVTAGTAASESTAPNPPASGPAATDTNAATTQTGATTPTAGITVHVDIAPALKARVGAGDVLFVFARAAQGPRMPLAIQRLPAASLPVTVVLDDSTSMMPSMKLSLIPQVVVGARISKSGQAAPSAGDLETLSEPISNAHAEPLTLVIDRVLP